MSKELLRQIYSARTYGDLYSLPLPVTVASLQDKNSFSSLNENSYWQSPLIGAPPEMKEAASLASAFDAKMGFTLRQEWRCRAHRHISENTAANINMIHADFIFEPKRRIYIVSDEAGTLAVSHADTFDIIDKDPVSRDILTLDIDESNVGRLKMHLERLAPQFDEAARALPIHTLSMMLTGTLHKRPPNVSNERVFFHAAAFTAD